MKIDDLTDLLNNINKSLMKIRYKKLTTTLYLNLMKDLEEKFNRDHVEIQSILNDPLEMDMKMSPSGLWPVSYTVTLGGDYGEYSSDFENIPIEEFCKTLDVELSRLNSNNFTFHVYPLATYAGMENHFMYVCRYSYKDENQE